MSNLVIPVAFSLMLRLRFCHIIIGKYALFAERYNSRPRRGIAFASKKLFSFESIANIATVFSHFQNHS